MPKVTFYNRDKREGNYSIEELFNTIRAGMSAEVEAFDFYFSKSVSLFRELYRAYRSQSDLNHITGDVNFLALVLRPSKTIITVHDVGHYENTLHGWKKWLYGMLWMRWPLKRVAAITTISVFTKERLIHHFNIPAKKIEVIHNPCPVSFVFSPRVFNAEKPRILQIGPGRNKNIHRLVEAVRGISCELVLLRKPDKDLERKLVEAEVDFCWKFNLSYQEVQEEYRQCDMLFFASEYEGFGMPILEANAIGRPVITGNNTAMPEVAGDAACYVDPFDVSAITKAILLIKSDSAYRDHLISKGLDNIARFKLEDISQKYLDLYSRIKDR